MWWRVLVGLFFLGHGFVHARWRLWWPGGGPRTSWLLSNAGEGMLRGLSSSLFVLAAIGFLAAGLGVFIQQGWWRPAAAISSVASLLLAAVFWYRGLIVGAAIDVAILIALWWLHWPPTSAVGS